jgi:tryptophan 7-halogenase
MTSTVKRIVIAGGGSIGWIAAAALGRALRHLSPDIVVLDAGAEDGAPPARWTLPSQRGAHSLTGIGEADFLRNTDATYRLGSEYLDWQGSGSRYLHAHAEIGAPIEQTPFYKYLVARAIAGKPESPESYSVGAAAARLGRFARPMGASDELTSGFTYGFHLDERAYVSYLRAHAEKSGVRRIAGQIGRLNRLESGDIDALVLEDGTQVAGDLFIDCTGRAGALITQLDTAPRIDWSRWLPCDRMICGLAAPLADPPALTRITASDAGWTFQAPLASASFVGHVYASAFLDDAAAAEGLQRTTGASRDVTVTRATAGRHARFWVRNCVAFGTAAAELEPLAGAELHFAQLGLATLLELFPLDARSAVEADEYNRLMGEQADALRDFTCAHYVASRRPGAFWDAARASAPPASLAAKLEMFAASGRIDIRDHETFEETDWAWLLLGSGLVPAALEWQIVRGLAVARPEQFAQLRGMVEKLVSTMPRHVDFLQRAKAAQPRPGAR